VTVLFFVRTVLMPELHLSISEGKEVWRQARAVETTFAWAQRACSGTLVVLVEGGEAESDAADPSPALLIVPSSRFEDPPAPAPALETLAVTPLPLYLLPPVETLLLRPNTEVSPHLQTSPPLHVLRRALHGLPVPSAPGTAVVLPGLGLGLGCDLHYNAVAFKVKGRGEGPWEGWGGVVGPRTAVLVEGVTAKWVLPEQKQSQSAPPHAAALPPGRVFPAPVVRALRTQLRLAAALSEGEAGEGEGEGPQAVPALARARGRGAVVVEGPAGAGKSQVVRGVARELGLPVVRVAAGRAVAEHGADADAALQGATQAARALAPAVVVVDDVDLLVVGGTGRAGARTRARLRASMGEGDQAVEAWVRRAARGGVGEGVAVVLTAAEGWASEQEGLRVVKLGELEQEGREAVLRHELGLDAPAEVRGNRRKARGRCFGIA
jgi:hypothetical protein